jgi:isopentenyl-diphosphate delta-isomerase
MHMSYFDVVNEEDSLLGHTASYDEVFAKGLWHRGVHVLIYTPDRQIVMQKRSPSLAYHPGEVEVSVGGGVDAGETPLQAAVREVAEELGLALSPEKLHYIGKTKYNHVTKTQLHRTFIYSYSICVPTKKLKLRISPEENTAVFLLSERKLRAALRRHRIRHMGRISGQYAYWRYLLKSMRAYIQS